MANISLVLRLLNGVARQVDLSTNTLVVSIVKVGGGAGTDLTKTILDRLVSLQNGSDVDATYHTHDGRYYTETELGSATGTTGSDLIGDDNTYSNFTPAAATVKGALSGIDTALGTKASTAYVDAAINGLDWKNSVRAATTANITLSGTQTIDGVSLIATNRVLVKNQTAGEENGIYVVAAGAWSRSTDADVSAEVTAGLAVFIEEGSLYGDSGWVLTTDNPITLGTTALVFAQFTGTGSITAGTGLSKTGNTIDFNTADTSLTVNADNVAVNLNTTGGLETSTGVRIKSDVTTANTIGVTTTANGAGTKFDSNSFADGGAETLALAAGVAGSGLALTTGVLSVNVDSSTLEINADTLRVKDAGITLAKLASDSVDENKIVSTTFSATGAVTGGSGTKVAVQVDNSTIEINANALRVKAAGITGTHLAASVAGAGLTGGAGSPLAVGAGDGITVNADDVAVNTTAIAGFGLENDGANNLRISTAAYDQVTITGGAGTAAAVQNAPVLKSVALIAGESFAADTTFVVRWARQDQGETVGRVYKAEKSTTTADFFWVIGVVKPAGAVSAGGTIDVTMEGPVTLGAGDTAFAAGDQGKPIYLQAAGAFSSAFSTTSGDALFVIGEAKTTTVLWVNKQLIGVN